MKRFTKVMRYLIVGMQLIASFYLPIYIDTNVNVEATILVGVHELARN